MYGFLPVSLLLALAATGLAACSPGAEQAPSHAAPGPPAVAMDEAARPAPDAMPASRGLDLRAAAWVERTLAAMSLRQRVAQLVMPWISGESASANPDEWERMVRWVAEDEVGGLIVSKGAPPTLAAKLNEAQRRSRVPLLVVSDLETGPGMRLTPGGTDFPPAMAFGAADDVELAREAGRVTGTEARAVGIHLTLGPVLDVNSNPDNPIINVRSFGADPERVARMASAWLEGARETGLLAAGKHFPGHGDTEVDSHVGLATIYADSARLARMELVPFRRAVRAGIDGILVGHIAVAAIDGPGAPPASLSPQVIGEVLRRRLGFDGLVFTDALNMGAITRHYPVGEASILALQAGADVLLQPPGTSAVIDDVVRAVESGRLPRQRVDEAARRVLVAKASAGLHRRSRVPVDSVSRHVGTPAHRAVARSVARASVTLARDAARLVPIAPATRRVLHVAYTVSGGGSAGSVLADELAAAGLRVDRARVGPRTTPSEFGRLRQRAAAVDLVVVSVSVAPQQYRELGIEGGLPGWVDGLARAGRPVIAISLGSPYVIEAFPSVPTYLLGWSASEISERAVARALLGSAPIRGRLPVPLSPPPE